LENIKIKIQNETKIKSKKIEEFKNRSINKFKSQTILLSQFSKDSHPGLNN